MKLKKNIYTRGKIRQFTKIKIVARILEEFQIP